MPTKPVADSLLLRVVEGRAEGFSWEYVAESVGKSVSAIRKWPDRYPARWEAAMKSVSERVLLDAGAEGICVFVAS
jgi:hypothetical protein